MPVTINADTSTGGAVVTADASGVLALQAAGSTGLTLNTSLALGVGSGNSTGTTGQVLTSSGSGAAPTWANAPAPVPTFTASGSISAAGVSVALNSDGTVSQITGSVSSFNVGTPVAPGNRNGSFMAASYDPVNQRVLVLLAFSSFVMGYVGTVSGTSISFGSEQTIFSTSGNNIAVDYDTANSRFLLANGFANGVRCVTLTVSGNSISVGATTTLSNSANYNQVTCTYNPIVGRFLVTSSDNTAETRTWVVTISGTAANETAYYPGFPASASVMGAVYSPVSGNVLLTYQSTIAGATTLFIVPVQMASSGNFATVKNPVPIDTHVASVGNIYATPVYTGSPQAGYTLLVGYNSQGGVFVKSGYELAENIILSQPSLLVADSISRRLTAVNSPASANAAFIYVRGSNNNVCISTVFASVGQAPVVDATNVVITTGDGGTVSGFAYNTAQARSVAVYYNTATSRINSAVITNSGYNTNAQAFIGFSTESAANGATVGVSTYASVNSNVSGLALRTRYSVTYLGGLSTSNTGFPVAGTSYNATRILVGV